MRMIPPNTFFQHIIHPLHQHQPTKLHDETGTQAEVVPEEQSLFSEFSAAMPADRSSCEGLGSPVSPPVQSSTEEEKPAEHESTQGVSGHNASSFKVSGDIRDSAASKPRWIDLASDNESHDLADLEVRDGQPSVHDAADSALHQSTVSVKANSDELHTISGEPSEPGLAEQSDPAVCSP